MKLSDLKATGLRRPKDLRAPGSNLVAAAVYGCVLGIAVTRFAQERTARRGIAVAISSLQLIRGLMLAEKGDKELLADERLQD